MQSGDMGYLLSEDNKFEYEASDSESEDEPNTNDQIMAYSLRKYNSDRYASAIKLSSCEEPKDPNPKLSTHVISTSATPIKYKEMISRQTEEFNNFGN